jgi:hypothetical protein
MTDPVPSKDLLDQIAHWANQIPEAGPIRALLSHRPAPEPRAHRLDRLGDCKDCTYPSAGNFDPIVCTAQPPRAVVTVREEDC